MTANLLAAQPIVWEPPPEVVENANLTAFIRQLGLTDYDALLARADADPDWWWDALARRIRFYRPCTRALTPTADPAFPRWFAGGTTNIVLNSLDCHRGTPVWDQPAIIGEPEAGAPRVWTYAELARQTAHLAGALSGLGIQPGEVVAIYMPNVNEAAAALLAVAKIGAIAMPLFSGFGVEAIASRLAHSGAVAILTVDGTTRRGRWSPMLAAAEEAAARFPGQVRHIVCLTRDGLGAGAAALTVDWAAVCAGQPDDVPTREMDAEAPVLLMYTSGTSGAPKGTVHTHAGFACKLSLDLGLMMDWKPTDRVIWQSDMGWLVGPLVAFGVTQIGACFILPDGAPNYPDPARAWKLIERHRVTVMGLAPTLVRGFMHGVGTGGCDLSLIRLCVSTGEAWTPDAWWWTFEHVLRRQGPLINYTGGTEIGGGILSGVVIRPMKPCAFSGPVPGIGADVVDAEGRHLGPNTVGELVLRRQSVGLTRGLWKDRQRFLNSYYRDIPGVWRQGDWAYYDQDGFWFVLGRSDDTLKIAGKRTGPAEVEALLAATGKVAEAAAIGVPDPIKGEAVGCVVVPRAGPTPDEALRAELEKAVTDGLGHPFKPAFVLFVGDLPKTRNMKVMRRVVRAACLDKPLGDTSSLVNPEAAALVAERARALGLAREE